MSDLIRRIDAMQACQVAPSDEWSKATKGGYNQAATDCAMALLKCEPVPPTLSAAMELPEVRAMKEALELARNRLQRLAIEFPTESEGRYEVNEWVEEATAALAAIKEPKT